MVDNFVDRDWLWNKFWQIHREIMDEAGPDVEISLDLALRITKEFASFLPKEEDTEYSRLASAIEKFSSLIRDTNCDRPDNNIAWQDGEIHVFNEKGDALYSAPTLLDLIRKVGESS